MKILYCYRYGILGGVCTQILNRLGPLMTRHGIETHLLFAEDHGISRTLGDYPHVYFESDPAKVLDRVTQGAFDLAVVIDTLLV